MMSAAQSPEWAAAVPLMYWNGLLAQMRRAQIPGILTSNAAMRRFPDAGRKTAVIIMNGNCPYHRQTRTGSGQVPPKIVRSCSFYIFTVYNLLNMCQVKADKKLPKK